MSIGSVLVVTFIVVIFGFFGVLFTVLGLRDRRRRQRRAENGARVGAVVSAVEPMVPAERHQYEQPFWLRFGAPDAPEHTVRFRRGFGGIVPAEGWRVTVMFDPDDPDNVEITENRYLHGISGPTTAPKPGGRRGYRWALAAATVGLLGWGIALFGVAATGEPAAQQGRFLLGMGLVFGAAAVAVGGAGAAMLTTALRSARSAVVTTGTITHTWSETRRTTGGSDASVRTTVYPYSVRFGLPDGRLVHRRAPDSPAFDRNVPGRQVRVAYQPDDPGRFMVGAPRRALLGPVLVLLFGGVFAGAGILLAVLA